MSNTLHDQALQLHKENKEKISIQMNYPVAELRGICHSREGGNPDWIPDQVGDDAANSGELNSN